jgi:transglutaminase-like putative cysteine protease
MPSSENQGVEQHLAALRRMITPTEPHIVALRTRLLKKNKTRLDVISAIFDWAHTALRYSRDINDITQSPLKTLNHASGDSEDIALLLASLLDGAGFRTRFKVVTTHEDWPFHHIYVQVYSDGAWLSLDPLYAFKVNQEPENIIDSLEETV